MSPADSAPVLFTDAQRHRAVSALHSYRMETLQYLRSAKYAPCHPRCVHCAPKVARAAEVAADLQRRYDDTVGALTALGAGLCGCGFREGEHWVGDHE